MSLEQIPAGEYEIPTDHVLDTAVVRVVFERTEPTVDVHVQGDWTLRTLERHGEPLAAPSDGTYTLRIDGISMGGTIDCNDYGGVLQCFQPTRSPKGLTRPSTSNGTATPCACAVPRKC